MKLQTPRRSESSKLSKAAADLSRLAQNLLVVLKDIKSCYAEGEA